jgi:hypothetical protein
MTCTARIRPFRPINNTEIHCEIDAGLSHSEHRGTLRDYAFPGSATELTWWNDDRRTFHGEWPGHCLHDECILPAGHRGEHAE